VTCTSGCVCAAGVCGAAGAATSLFAGSALSGFPVLAGGTAKVGRTDRSGLITRRGGSAAGAGGAATTFSAAGGAGAAGGFAAAGGVATGRDGGAGGVGGSAFLRSRFATSPGFEMCERSILVLISDSLAREPPSRAEADGPPCPERCLRTRSASSASMELECVFFSVTPTRGRTSRIALLLTSSSLARSLIRTLLIRPVFSPKSR